LGAVETTSAKTYERATSTPAASTSSGRDGARSRDLGVGNGGKGAPPTSSRKPVAATRIAAVPTTSPVRVMSPNTDSRRQRAIIAPKPTTYAARVRRARVATRRTDATSAPAAARAPNTTTPRSAPSTERDSRTRAGPLPFSPAALPSTIGAVPELIVDGKRIHDGGDAYVVAEIGHNHQGDIEKAKALIHAARECGVDAVKLQKRDNRRLYTRAQYEAPYDNEHSFGATYGEHREALELSASEWLELREFSREEGVTLFGTVFDEPSADFLAELGVPAFKIASADLVNTPLLRHVAAFGRPLFVSTGGGTIEDVERAVDAILPLNTQLCLLQCTASYPCAVEELNLGVIETYRERFPDVLVGLSDHQSGIAMSLIGYMLGARVIEKHFTLDHAWKGSDHAFSLMPEGMRRLVRDLRRVPDALGDGVKRRLSSEERPLERMGKKLVAVRDLPAGHVLADGDLEARSPADGGLPPYELDGLLGRALVRSVAFQESISLADVEPAGELAAPGPRSREA
jgi:N-acetylneuraminate synthase/sialic acid synthase